jgi:hypothetical protein
MKTLHHNITNRLGKFKKGWFSTKAPQPSGLAISLAEGYLEIGGIGHAKPSKAGIEISAFKNDRKTVVEIHNDGRTYLILSDDLTPQKVTLHEAVDFVKSYLEG